MRKTEFEIYLSKNYTPAVANHYMDYCRYIERVMGEDIDDTIVSHRKILSLKPLLEAHYAPNAVIQILQGFNAYLQFAFSIPKSIVTFPTSVHASSLYHVSRTEDVPLTADIAFICEILEQEYTSVVRFAEKLLPQSEFKFIPIIISDKEPIHESPDGGEKILGAFFASNKPYIEIYYQNADPHDAASFRKCLAHEYMHYLHYAYTGKKYDETKKELKEALADFFGVLYSIHRGQKSDLNVAESRYERWKKNFGTYWPYAYALHFLNKPYKSNLSDYTAIELNRAAEKLRTVFRATIDAEKSYLELTN